MPKYPKTIYVKEQTEPSGDKWLHASKDSFVLTEMGEKARVGVYKLVETIEVEGIAKIKKVG